MPETIVPELLAIRQEAIRLLCKPQTGSQVRHHLPKHFPAAATTALLEKVFHLSFDLESLAKQAETQARELARQQEREAALNAPFMAQLDEWDAQEDVRLFMESCAVEHLFHPGILAG